jgi:ABC-type glycerol-3-phosphate transport system permease component
MVARSIRTSKISRLKKGSPAFNFINTSLLIIATAAFLYPFVYVLSVSISDSTAIANGQVWLWPVGIDFRAYRYVLSNDKILAAFFNTVMYAVVGCLLTLVLNILVAYPLSIKGFKAKGLVVTFFAIPMFFSGGMIPTFLLVKSLGLLDTMWSFLLPAVGMWTIVMFRANFQNIPDSIHESAYIDGASHWRILFQLIIPLSKAIIAAITLFTAVGIWNSYYGPMLYLSSPSKYPLQVVLRAMIQGQMSIWTGKSLFDITGSGNPIGMNRAMKMAAIIVSTGPIILVYPFLQKYFVKGVLIGSIKG